MAPKRKAAQGAALNPKRLAVVADMGIEIQGPETQLEEGKKKPVPRRRSSAQKIALETDTFSRAVDSKSRNDGLAPQVMSAVYVNTGGSSLQPPASLVSQVNNVAAHAQSYRNTCQTTKGYSRAPTADMNSNPGYESGLLVPATSSTWNLPQPLISTFSSQPMQDQSLPQQQFLPELIYQDPLDTKTQEMARVWGLQFQQGMQPQQFDRFDQRTESQPQQYQRYAPNQPSRPRTGYTPSKDCGDYQTESNLPPLSSGLPQNRQQSYPPAQPRVYTFVNNSNALFPPGHDQANLESGKGKPFSGVGPERDDSSADGYQPTPAPSHCYGIASNARQSRPSSADDRSHWNFSSLNPDEYFLRFGHPGPNPGYGGTANVSTSSTLPPVSRQETYDYVAAAGPDKLTTYPSPTNSTVRVISANQSLLPSSLPQPPDSGAAAPSSKLKSAEKRRSRVFHKPVPIPTRLRNPMLNGGRIAGLPRVLHGVQGQTDALSSDSQEPTDVQARLEFKHKPLTAHLDPLGSQNIQRPVTPGGYQAGFYHSLNHMLISARPELLDPVSVAGLDPSRVPEPRFTETWQSSGTIDPARLDSGCIPEAPYLEPGQNRGHTALQQENHIVESAQDPPGAIGSMLGARSRALKLKSKRTREEEDEMRLCNALATTLTSYESAKGQQATTKVSAHQLPSRPDQYSHEFSRPSALEMMEQIGAEKRDPSLFIHDGQNGLDHCSFCNYECTFGISDSQVWLPVEASQGFCRECHDRTMSAVALWQTCYKLPFGMGTAAWIRHNKLALKWAEPPLKEMSDELDFRAQASREMAREDRTSIIEFYRARRAEQMQKTPPQIPRTFADGGTSSASDPGPSPSGGPPCGPSDPGMGQAMRTSWNGGVPSHMHSLMPDLRQLREPVGGWRRAPNDHAQRQDRVVTPNGVEVAKMMGFAAIPSSQNTAAPGCANVCTSGMSPAGVGTSSGAASGINAAVCLASSSANSNKTQQPQDPAVSRDPPGAFLAGIQRHENHGPGLPGPPIDLNGDGIAPAARPGSPQQQSLLGGPSFCRGSPWRQVDFTKATICLDCFLTKSKVKHHIRHAAFVLLSQVPGGGAWGHDIAALKVGRVATDQVVRDQRCGNCMVCTNQAMYGCADCPLRVCVECQVHLAVMCKGRLNNLLDFYAVGRDHIRNDAFLFRSDGRGF